MSDQVLAAIVTGSAGIVTALIANWPKRRRKKRPPGTKTLPGAVITPKP